MATATGHLERFLKALHDVQRRVTAVVSLEGDLDANYSAVKTDNWQWYGTTVEEGDA